MLSLDSNLANAIAQNEGAVANIQFLVRSDPAPGWMALTAWQNALTGDLFYAPQGSAPPYACYESINVGPLGFVARPGQGAFDLHLWIGADGITQIVSNTEAAQIGLAGKGYSDLGALFASA